MVTHQAHSKLLGSQWQGKPVEDRVYLNCGIPGQPVFDFLLWHHFSMGAPHWTPPGLHLAQSFLFRSNQQGWSATGFAFFPLPVVTVYFMNLALLMESAGHFGLEGLLGFFAWLLPWLLSFTGLLLGGLHNHQEEQQQDHQLVPPHDVLRGGRERDGTP